MRFTSVEQARLRMLRPPQPPLWRRAWAFATRRFIRRRSALPQQRVKREAVGMGLWGTNLTFHYGRDGHGMSLAGPPVPLHAPQARRRTYSGRDLSVHIDSRGHRTRGLPALVARERVHPVKAVLLAIWAALKWLFKINPRLQIIERYIWGEAIGLFLIGTLGFTIFMVITTVFGLGEKILGKQFPPFTIAKVLLLSAPQFLVLAVPVAVLFATLMAMNRLNRDNELVAMTTTGVSLYRIFLPFIAVAIGAGMLTWSIYEFLVPPYTREFLSTIKVFATAQVVDFIKPGIVIKAPDRKYFYVDSIDTTEGVMYKLRLYDYLNDDNTQRNFPRVFLAERAYVRDSYLVLNDVKFYELDRNTGGTLVEAQMPEVKIDISTRLGEPMMQASGIEMTAAELRTRISRTRDRVESLRYVDRRMQLELNRDWTEYYFKFTVPLACLAFVLVAVPVSLRGPRDERNLGLIVCFILVMIYYILFFICREIGARGVFMSKDIAIAGLTLAKANTNLFPPILAGWLAPAVFFIGGGILIARARR